MGPTLPPQLQAVQPSPATLGHRKSPSVREHTESLSEAEERRHKKTFSLIDCLFNWDGASLCQEPHQQACSVPQWSPRGRVPGPRAVVGLRDPLQSSVPWEADVTGSLIPPSTTPSYFWGQNRERKSFGWAMTSTGRVLLKVEGRPTTFFCRNTIATCRDHQKERLRCL